MPPEMLVTAGANGSGKSTFAYQYARKHQLPYLGADAIAAELAAQGTPSQVEAGRRFFADFDRFLERRQSFIVETTLSGLGFRGMIERATIHGFQISLFYIYVDSPEVCIARVSERVRKGGHHVPEADIRRRFCRSFANFWNIYRLMSQSWVVVYNQEGAAEEIMLGERQEYLVLNSARFASFLELIRGVKAQ